MNNLKRVIILLFLTAFCAQMGDAQTFPEPRREKLLNDLKLLVWRDPAAPKVTVKLRIHNGAAFDPKDKMGTMALLSDIIFPNIEDTKAFFAEDLAGSLDVVSNYDYIQITATGSPESIQTILETYANAVTNPPITAENFTLVRNARLEKIKELEKNPSYLAERAVAKRLFGEFPYGRSAEGTAESLAKIDRPDILFARDRFFSPDNSTLAVVGNVNTDAIYKTVRQLFGAWQKADNKIPATFRQPDAPTTGNLFVESPNYEKAEIRQAVRGLARNSKDFPASTILAGVLADRFQNAANGTTAQISSVSEPHLLFGTFVIKASVPADKAADFSEKAKNPANMQAISQAEFDKSKAFQIAEMNRKLSDKSLLADFWLDADTYKLTPVAQQYKDLQNVTLADVNNVFQNVIKKSPFVAVVVGDAAKLKAFVETGQSR
jgi:zinc protease